jgi:site-specific recombinase XerD
MCTRRRGAGSSCSAKTHARERLVPLGEDAMHTLREFTREGRAQMLGIGK